MGRAGAGRAEAGRTQRCTYHLVHSSFQSHPPTHPPIPNTQTKAKVDKHLQHVLDLVEERSQRALWERDGEKADKAKEGAEAFVNTCLRLLLNGGSETTTTENNNAAADLVGVVVGALRRAGDSAQACLPAVRLCIRREIHPPTLSHQHPTHPSTHPPSNQPTHPPSLPIHP